MANGDTKVKIVDIQVRYQGAVDALAKYRSAIQEAKKYQKELTKDLKDGKITQEHYDKSMEASSVFIRQQSEQVRVLSKQISNQIKVSKEQEGSLKQLRAELSNATSAWDGMSRAERNSSKGQELKNHINEITAELKAAEEETQRFYRNVGNYKSATEGLEQIKLKVQDLGKSLLVAFGGGSLLNFGKQSVDVSREFGDAMARVNSVIYDTTLTEKENADNLSLMREEARKMGRETIYHATDAAAAMETLARGGFTAEESTMALSKTLELAQSNVVDLDTAADIMIRTMRGFDLPISPEEMEHANDVLSKAASSASTNLTELAEALKNAAPFGHALKQPIEEVSAALGVLADVGVRGSDAGTALRMVILGLSTSTKKQQKVFKEFGIDINQASLEADGLTETLKKLKASGIMESSESANKLADVFGRRCTPQVMALVNNIDRLDGKLQALNESQGTTERMFEQSYTDVSKAFFTLSSAWESFKISLGESNSGALIAPLKGLTELVNWLEGHLPELANFILTLIASISFAKLVNSAKTSFTTIRNSAISNAEAATNTVNTLQQQQMALRKNIAAQTTNLENATGTERTMIEARVLAQKRELAETEKALVKAKTNEIAVWEKAAALNSSSAWSSAMTACSVAVQGFVTAAKTALKGFVFTAVIMLAFEAIQKLFSLIDTSSGSTFGKITSAVSGFVKKGLNILINAFNSVVAWIKDFVENSRIMQVWLFSLKTQFAAIGFVFKTVWTLLKTGIKQIGNAFKGLISIVGGVATALEGLFTLNWDNVKKGIKQVGDAVVNFWKDTTTNFKDAGEDIAENFKGAVEDVKGAADDLVNSKAFGGTGNAGGATTPAPKKFTKGTSPTKTETETEDSDGGGGGTGSGSGKTKTDKQTEKEAREAKKRAKLEMKALEELEQAMLDLMEDTAQKRRLQLEKRYNDEIRKLKVRLATEKNLTENAKEAIRQTIILKERKLKEELEKLTEEELKREVQERQKLIESRLSIVKKGSAQELRLKKEQLKEKLALDEQALREEERVAKKDAEQRLQLAIENYGEESSEAAKARLYQLEIESSYLDRKDNLYAAHRQKQRELEQQFQQDLISLRQQAWQNEIQELENRNLEWLLAEQGQNEEERELYLTQQEGLQMLNLQVVTQGEMDVLAAKQAAAEERYNALVAAGQLEGETTEAFNARILAAEKSKLEAKKAYRDAELKNEKAYYNSSKALTNSLISLTAAIGESDENMARLSKILTLAQIAIDTGKALSAGIASASSMPYPANLAAIATTVATVLTNVATAISTVKSAKFAHGGKVEGPGTGTSDSIPAQLSNGEFVMTAKATRLFEPLLVTMNKIGAGVLPPQPINYAYQEPMIRPDEFHEFTQAVMNIRPVVSVEEITEVKNRVEVIQTLDNI